MENEPSTPTQSSPVDVNDVGGPGLFSADKNARIEMESAMSERPRTDDSPTRQDMDLDQNEQQETNDGTTSDSSQTQRSGETTTPATTKKSHQAQPSSAAQMMGPPPRPDFKATPTSAQPPQQSEKNQNQEQPTQSANKIRGGGSRIPTASKPENSTPRKTNGKHTRNEPDPPQETPKDDAETEVFNDPSNPLAAFDWMELEARYHQEMDDYLKQEHEIFRSFRELCQVKVTLKTSPT